MKVPPRDVSEKAAALVKRVKELEAGVQRVVDVVSDNVINRLLEGSVDVGYRLVIGRLEPMKPGGLRHGWDILRARGADAVVLVSTDAETGKPIMLAAADDAAVRAGFNAGAAIKEMAPLVGGRGGGKPAMAQGGGDDAAGIDVALSKARQMLGAT